MDAPAYPAARAVAARVEAHFARHVADALARGAVGTAPAPGAAVIELLVDTAFWASLRREEGRTPRISLALLPPTLAERPLHLERWIPLTPDTLVQLAPAVERPGIHLGVWHEENVLHVWGATRAIPDLCFVLEVVEPGLLVIKHRRGEESGKFANVAVLRGDQVRVVDERSGTVAGCPPLVASLLGLEVPAEAALPASVLIQLAVSMRAHGHGGALLVVPDGSSAWCASVVHPIRYAVEPGFVGLAELVRRAAELQAEALWRDGLRRAVEGVAGLTAVDGATVMTSAFEVLAFGAKIGRREGAEPVDRVVVSEPVIGGVRATLHPTEIGGTRHLSAAQFVHDQRDALALVASQDGRFTVFDWSDHDDLVHAHRIETFLM